MNQVNVYLMPNTLTILL